MHVSWSRSFLVLALSSVMLAAAACGGGDGGGQAASAQPVQSKVSVTPETASQAFALSAGNYRVNWKTTGCKSVDVTLTGDNGFTKEKKSQIPNFSWIVTSVPDGTYTATQTDTTCTTWELTIEKVG